MTSQVVSVTFVVRIPWILLGAWSKKASYAFLFLYNIRLIELTLERTLGEPYTVLDLNAQWASPNKAFRITFLLNNLFDEVYTALASLATLLYLLFRVMGNSRD